MTQTAALEKQEYKAASQAMAVVEKGHAPAKPQRMTLREIQQWGEVFHQSGMFADVRSAAAAMVKIKAGEELGFGPFASMAGIDIIKGKVSVGSGLQASLVKDSPRYRYTVRQLNTEGCVLEFFEKENGQWQSLGTSEFAKADAVTAGLAGGDNYKKYGRNMYFARALTNGMRWYTPDLLRSCVGQSETYDNFDVDETIAETQTPAEDDANVIDAVVITDSGEKVDTATGEVVEEDPFKPAVVSEEDAERAAIEAEAEPLFTPEEGNLIDLRTAVTDAYNSTSGESRQRANKYLDDKTIGSLDAEGMRAFLAAFPNM